MTLPIIILAGGLGSRLDSLTKNTPKALVLVANKPFIFHQIELLKEQGFSEIIISINHLGKEIIRALGDGSSMNINISYEDDGKFALGTGGAIKKISKKMNTPFFVMYGDSYLNVAFQEVEKSFEPGKGPLMVIYKNNNKYDSSNVLLNNDSIIYSKNKIPRNAIHIDYGLGIYEKSHFKKIKKSKFDLSVVQETYSKKKELQHFISEKRFYEVGSVEGLDELNRILK